MWRLQDIKMTKISLYLGQINGTVNVQILRKNIKNVHLKVFRNFEVVLSVPVQVPEKWIIEFLSKRTKWIDNQISKYKLSNGTNTMDDIKNGTSIQMLGKDFRLHIVLSLKKSIVIDEKKITLYAINANDSDEVMKYFWKWWREQAYQVFNLEIESIYNKVIKKYDIPKPALIVRKMKTMWGSCSPKLNKITLNEALLKANIRCIQYVVLHELTHLLYPNHNSQFYDFLTIQMPYWQERNHQNDNEVLQGL